MPPPSQGRASRIAELRFVLPFPPSVNRYYRHVGYRTLLSRDGRNYRKTVLALLAGRVRQPLSRDLEVELDLYPPDRRRRDIDNFHKALLDALQHAGVYVNDCQIKKLTTEMYPRSDPRAEIVIRERDPDQNTQESDAKDASV